MSYEYDKISNSRKEISLNKTGKRFEIKLTNLVKGKSFSKYVKDFAKAMEIYGKLATQHNIETE